MRGYGYMHVIHITVIARWYGNYKSYSSIHRGLLNVLIHVYHEFDSLYTTHPD